MEYLPAKIVEGILGHLRQPDIIRQLTPIARPGYPGRYLRDEYRMVAEIAQPPAFAVDAQPISH